MRAFEVPGHEVIELLGYGATGEVWRARRGAELVVLRRLATAGEQALGEVRRQATVVRSLTTRHLVRVKTMTRVHGDDVLVLDHAACGSLEALLTERGTLTPGEVVTVLAPLAEALGQAHAHDLRHRRLGASRVLLAADGMPMLDGLGLDPLHDPKDSLDPTGALGPTADVWALGALGHRMLTGTDPGHLPELPATTPRPLADALLSALDPDPFARPRAEDLAAALLASCPAGPLTGLPEPVQLPAPAAPRLPRAVPKPLIVAGAATVALVAVVALGWTWGARSAPATASMTRVRTDWVRLVADLDGARSRAFGSGDAALLTQVYRPGSALLRADVAALAQLRSQHATARGLQHRVLSAVPASAAEDRVELTVREQLSAYTLVDGRGAVLERHTAGPVQQVLLVLVRDPAGSRGWRLGDVRPGG
ncbi:MAG: serine/threonine protein kinase [Frankiales bacterium]|nr:serine/threonine protein kinase [Frankiales bacterium]